MIKNSYNYELGITNYELGITNYELRMLSRLLLAGILVMMIWIGLLSNPASSQQVESRINNLEVDLNGLELRLSRVEAQLNQLRQSPSLGIPTIPPSLPSPRRNLSEQERLRILDRLATLVVELKQQVIDTPPPE